MFECILWHVSLLITTIVKCWGRFPFKDLTSQNRGQFATFHNFLQNKTWRLPATVVSEAGFKLVEFRYTLLWCQTRPMGRSREKLFGMEQLVRSIDMALFFLIPRSTLNYYDTSSIIIRYQQMICLGITNTLTATSAQMPIDNWTVIFGRSKVLLFLCQNENVLLTWTEKEVYLTVQPGSSSFCPGERL